MKVDELLKEEFHDLLSQIDKFPKEKTNQYYEELMKELKIFELCLTVDAVERSKMIFPARNTVFLNSVNNDANASAIAFQYPRGAALNCGRSIPALPASCPSLKSQAVGDGQQSRDRPIPEASVQDAALNTLANSKGNLQSKGSFFSRPGNPAILSSASHAAANSEVSSLVPSTSSCSVQNFMNTFKPNSESTPTSNSTQNPLKDTDDTPKASESSTNQSPDLPSPVLPVEPCIKPVQMDVSPVSEVSATHSEAMSEGTEEATKPSVVVLRESSTESSTLAYTDSSEKTPTLLEEEKMVTVEKAFVKKCEITFLGKNQRRETRLVSLVSTRRRMQNRAIDADSC